MPAPRVSVIMPCFDLGRYLDEAVDSVFAQTFQDFEILIVNDGSTDAFTNQLLAEYSRPKTRVFTTENRGVSAARNLALEHAVGDYVCALDPDDKLEPTHFEKTVRILDANPDLTFVSCWLQNFGDADWVWKPERIDLPMLLVECTICTASLVRRDAVLSVGGFDEHMPLQGYEDWDLWISLVERGFQGIILPEILFLYRRRQGSLSEPYLQGEPHLGCMQYLIDKHEQSYRAHLFEVLLVMDAVCCKTLQTNYTMEREIATELVPRVQDHRAELARLERKLEALPRPPAAEPARSWRQWRAVAPLRAANRLRRRLLAHARRTV